MSTAVLEAPTPLFIRGRRPTLEELLEGRWRAAHTDGDGESRRPERHHASSVRSSAR